MKNLIKIFLSKLGYKLNKVKSTENHLTYLKSNFNIKTIFDVGAHHGETALEYSKFFPTSKIYSFEPFYDSFEKLENNISSITNVKTFNIGLSNKTSSMEFNINEGSPTNSILRLSDNAPNTWDNSGLNHKNHLECQFKTIDDFMSKNEIEEIDLLKIDTQGSEYLVLEGAEKVFQKSKIKTIYMEIIIGDTYVGQKSLSYYLNKMESYEFKLQGFYDLTFNTKSDLIQLDALFIHKNFINKI